MELVRQPVFLLLMTCASGFSVLLAAVPYFGFGDDPKLVKDSTLAVMLLSGLFGAVVSASATVTREIRQGTALAVLSKPVGRHTFLLAKYTGLAAAITVLTYANLVATLLASRMAFDAYGDADLRALGIFAGSVLLAYAIGGFSNYFLQRPFVADAVVAFVILTTLAFLTVHQFLPKPLDFDKVRDVDWRLVPAAVLILFALWILAGVALACATRLEMVPTLAVCTSVFLLGLMSDYLFGQRTEPVWTAPDLRAEAADPGRTELQRRLLKEALERYDLDQDGRLSPKEQGQVTPAEAAAMRQAGLGGSWWAAALYTVVPNWQLFWLADVLEGKPGTPITLPDGTQKANTIPWGYVAKALTYVAGYLGAALVAGLLLFQERELS